MNRSAGRGARAATLLAALLGTTAAGASDPATRWEVGRGPEVFQSGAPLATRIGGWLNASYEDNDLDGSTRSINLNHANVFLDTRRGEHLQIFGEFEFEHEKALGGFEDESEYEVEQLYARYRHSDALQVRAGYFNTPFGFWTPVHWSILMDTIQPPLHEGQRLIPEQQAGMEISGELRPSTWSSRNADLRYAIFAGHGARGSLWPANTTDGLSYGVDLRVTVRELHFVGLSAYAQQRDLERDRDERSLALYGQLGLTNVLTLRGEYVLQRRDHTTLPGLARSVNAAYVKLRWDLHPRAYANYRFNWGDGELEDATATDREYVHTLTLGYRPRPPLRIKLEFADHGFRGSAREDYHYWGASVGVLF